MIDRYLRALVVACLAACSGGRSEPASPPAPAATGDASPFAADVGDALARMRGAKGMTPPLVSGGILLEGEKTVVPISVGVDDCGVFVARGSRGVTDVDLYVFAEDGETLASDETSGEQASVVVCPPHPRTLYAVVKVVAGAGSVGLAATTGKTTSATALAKTLGARGLGVDSGRLDSWPGLAQEIADRRRALGGTWSDVRRSALPVDPRSTTRASIEIDAGRCVDVLVVPSEEVQSLELVATGNDDRFVARANNAGRERTLLLCAGERAAVHLSIRPRGAPGIVALVVAASRPGAMPQLPRAIRVESATELRRIDDAVRDFLAGAAVKPREIGRAIARIDRATTMKIELTGVCTRLDLVVGTPTLGVRASVWTSTGLLRGEGQGGNHAVLFGCGDDTAARFEAIADVRDGPFALFSRPVVGAPALAAASPLAASRLLSRLHADGIEVPFDHATLEKVTLDETRRLRRVIKLPANACAIAGVALDGRSSGIEVAADDGATRRVTEEPSSWTERVCAGATPHEVAFDLRTLAGGADALWYVRTP